MAKKEESKLPTVEGKLGMLRNLILIGLRRRVDGKLDFAMMTSAVKADQFYHYCRNDDDLTSRYSRVYLFGDVGFPFRHMPLSTAEERKAEAKRRAEEANRLQAAANEERARLKAEEAAQVAQKIREGQILLKRHDARQKALEEGKSYVEANQIAEQVEV